MRSFSKAKLWRGSLSIEIGGISTDAIWLRSAQKQGNHQEDAEFHFLDSDFPWACSSDWPRAMMQPILFEKAGHPPLSGDRC